MKKMQYVLGLAVLAAMLVGGCSSSEGTKFNYATGNLSATLSADVQKSYDASLKALEQLQITPAEKVKDSLGARIVARTSADKELTISLKRLNDTQTSIVIEVGFMGDNTTSKTIYDKIVENLGK
jgi:outer membrane murein-binding lipoprotein Lpp